MKTKQKFKGDQKVGESHLHYWEQKLVSWGTPKIPRFIETYHLTASTICWCIGVLIFGYLAKFNIHWLWGSILMIILQYITDLFDGAVGRYRKTGLIKWGYYADHFLDYIFMCCILVGYTFFIPDQYNILFYVLIVYGAFMVNAFVSFNALNEFRVSYFGFGPTEGRLGFMFVNMMLIIFGSVPLSKFLPHLLAFVFGALVFVIWRTQKKIWEIDMQEKEKMENGNT